MAIKLSFKKILQIKSFSKTLIRYINENTVRGTLFHACKSEGLSTRRKVSIVGASGNVGTASANNLILKNICEEIVLVDIKEKKDKLCGEALDYAHFSSIQDHPQVKICFNSEETKNSDLIIICAGQRPAKSPEEELNANAGLYKKIIPRLATLSKDAVILVVSDPVDIMAYAAWKYSGFDKNRVFGTGTELDCSRFRYVIGKKLGISPKSVNAWVIGEQGKNGIPCWSTVDVAGIRLREINPCVGTNNDKEKWYCLFEEVAESGRLLNTMKGNCKWSISAIIENFAEAILFNTKNVHAASINCNGLYGIETDTFLSLPVVLGNRGVVQIVKQSLSASELHKLQAGANSLKCKKDSICW